MTLEPILLALLASACFGLALVVTQFGLRHVPAMTGALVSIPATTVLFWLLSPALLDLGGWQMQAAVIFALVGLFFPAAVTLLTYEANQRMGPTITGAVGSTAPLFAATAAVLLLGERLTILGALATAAIVAGVATLSWQSKNYPLEWPSRFLLLPLTAAALRGLAQAAIKLGLAIWPSPFAASLIGYTVSVASVAAGTRLRQGQMRPRLNIKGALWFLLVGLSNGAAVLSMYAALNLGAVTLVAPSVATYPLFSLLFGALLLPGERITPRIVTGVALTVAGVAGLLLAR
jgi:drug/metabolite transporter (DMT)-like permease